MVSLNLEAVTGAHVWRSDRLWTDHSSRFALTGAQIADLRALRHQPLQPVTETETAPGHLSSWAPVLDQARKELETGSGVFLLKGMDWNGMDLADIGRGFYTVACQLGTPVSQSAHGERLFHVQDQGHHIGESKARGPNTRQALSFHTDRCDVIAFACIRQAAEGGDNLLASSAAIHNTMLDERPDLLRILYQPFFWLRHNVDTGNPSPWMELPVFAPHKGRFMANIMRVLILRGHQHPKLPPLTDLQRDALDRFESTARRSDICVQHCQEPGDMLFLNNLTVVHSRTEFRDHDDSERKRLLLRIWLSTPNSRELAPAYGALYGTNAGGALRGGIHPSTSTSP